jgi:hypothetical protein
MKKFILRLVIVLVLILVIAGVAMAMSLNWVIKKGVQTVGGRVTKVDVTLKSVSLSLLSGAGDFKGFVVGNAAQVSSPAVANVGHLALDMAREMAKGGTNSLQNLPKGLGDFLKKK